MSLKGMEDRQRLDQALVIYEQMMPEFGHGGDCWTCDGGAVVLKHMCDRLGLEAELKVGLYHWREERLLEKYKFMEGVDLDLEDPEDAEILADYWDDEHHHWVLVYLEDGIYLLDPNGETRGNERLASLWDVEEAYEATSEDLVGVLGLSSDEIAVFHSEVREALPELDRRLELAGLCRPPLSELAKPTEAEPPAPEQRPNLGLDA